MSTTNNHALPEPDADALRHSNNMHAHLRDYIASNEGVICFSDYMHEVLYAPALGYYVAGTAKIGAAGDFITAPEISSVFSRCVANAIKPVLHQLDSAVIYEFGAGRGRMAADIINHLQSINIEIDSYCIIEVSPDLAERQYQYLAQQVPAFINKIVWLSELPDKINGVVLANEVLDAMPVCMFRKYQDEVKELGVGLMQDELTLVKHACDNDRLKQRVREIEQDISMSLEPGYVSEVNFVAEDWLQEVAGYIERGAILIIDYGYPRHEYYHEQRHQGTLMCHYQHHSHIDPFVYPGLQDVTAHIDFTAIANAGVEAGLTLDGYTSQAHFLLENNFQEIVESLSDDEPDNRIKLSREVQKLVMPHEMGELFKVIGFSKNLSTGMAGFSSHDLSHKL